MNIERLVTSHLGSRQVSRVVYGAIIGLALIVALEAHPPSAGVVIASMLGTAVAVALAEIYAELVGLETRERRKARGTEMRNLRADSAAVALGVAFPALFFVGAAVHLVETSTAFSLAKWTGLALIGVYGFAGARLSGASLVPSLGHGLRVALIGAFLIALKALVH